MRVLLLTATLLITSVCVFAQQRNNKLNTKQEITDSVQHLKLYPTRATTYVNIYVEYSQPTDFTIKIVGSPLNDERKWELKAKSSYQQKLDVTQLPNGSYTITLEGGGIYEKAGFTINR